MNWFANMKLGTKLIGSYLVIAALSTIISIASYYGMNKMSFYINDLANNDGVLMDNGQRARANINMMRRYEKDLFMNVGDSAKMEEYKKKWDEALEHFNKRMEDSIKLLSDPANPDGAKGKVTIATIKKNIDAYASGFNTVYGQIKAGTITTTQDANKAIGQYKDATHTSETMVGEFSKQMDKNMDEMVKEATAGSKKIILTVTVLAFATILLAICIGVSFTRFLTRQLGGEPKYVGEIISEVAQGNLTMDVQIKTNDTTSMLYSLKEMVQTLRDIVGQTVEAANQVSDAADQISEANQSFSQKITEQAAAVEETTASMEEMGASTRSSAENAREANTLARNSKTVAEQGTVVMTDTITAMNEINKSSSKIANISNVIEEIAFQTNLLALNAAVEAARAGEHGKGFAVVAAEIRSLAGRTTLSAKEITSLIEDSGEKTDRGVQLAQELDKKLNEIVSGIKKVTDLMDEVAAASQEQSAGISQVNTAMSQVDQTTQQNASLVEETSASAEELAAQARALLDLVSFFQVEDTRRSAAKSTRVRQEPTTARALPSRAGFKSKAAGRPALAAMSQAPSGDQGDFSEF